MNSLLKYENQPTSLSQFFEDFLNQSGFESVDRLINGANWPRIDLTENDSEYMLRADLPGMTKNDFKVSVDNGVLRIEGEKTEDYKQKKDYYYHLERSYGKFSRSFVLPEEVETEKIEAKMENGVLELKLPKNEKAKPKLIEIKIN